MSHFKGTPKRCPYFHETPAWVSEFMSRVGDIQDIIKHGCAGALFPIIHVNERPLHDPSVMRGILRRLNRKSSCRVVLEMILVLCP